LRGWLGLLNCLNCEVVYMAFALEDHVRMSRRMGWMNVGSKARVVSS
jgi:hypothetical protein